MTTLATVRIEPSRVAALFVVWAFSSLVVACSSDVPFGGQPYAEVMDSAGVQITLNRIDENPVELQETLRLGTVDGSNEELLFFNVHDVLVDEDGRLFVANDQTGAVRLFDAEGTFIREFGGKGEGPSEIPARLNDLMWAGGQIAMIDWQRGGKTVLYDTTGVFVTSFRNTLPDGTRISLAAHTPQGWLATHNAFERPSEPVPGQRYSQPLTMRLVAPDLGGLADVFFELPPRVLYGSRSTHGLDWPLFDQPGAYGFDAVGNFYQVMTGQYRIDVRDATGALVRSVRATHDPVPITAADVEAFKDRVRVQYDTMSRIPPAQRKGELNRYLERIDEQATFPTPEIRPPLKTLLVALDGAFWVERLDGREPAEWWLERMSGGFSRAPTVSTEWDVYSSRGQFIGRVVLPPRFVAMAVTENSVVGVTRDEFDVEYVVRLALDVSLD